MVMNCAHVKRKSNLWTPEKCLRKKMKLTATCLLIVMASFTANLPLTDAAPLPEARRKTQNQLDTNIEVGSDHERVKRRQPSITPEEIQGIVHSEVKHIEELRKKCGSGYFLNMASYVCDSCDKHCKNGTEMESCGLECRGFYKLQKLEHKISQLEDRKSVSTTDIPKWAWPLMAGCITFATIAVSIGVGWCIYNWVKKKPPKAPISCCSDITPDGTLRLHGQAREENNREDEGLGEELLVVQERPE